MAAEIIDGKAIAGEVRRRVAGRVARLVEGQGVRPRLAVIRVGEDPASRVYVRNKRRQAEEVGIASDEHALPRDTAAADLRRLIDELNGNPEVHGILVQLPLPEHLDESEFFPRVDPAKDVDGLHPDNAGRLWLGLPGLVPCTPAGVLALLRHTGISLAGKQAVVVGRSAIVGKPVAGLLLREHATVTMCHSRTADLPAVCRRADVLVVAAGRAAMVRGDWIKPGALVIDVGINRGPDGRLVGDVDFDSARRVAGWITPVPGGVGPMTIAFLLHNTVEAAQAQAGAGQQGS